MLTILSSLIPLSPPSPYPLFLIFNQGLFGFQKMNDTNHNHASLESRHEKLPVKIFNDSRDASRHAAGEIAALIRERQSQGRACVLGLATGSTPVWRLRGTGAPAPRGRPVVRQRRDVQSRRVLSDAARRAAELRPVHAGAPVRPRSTSSPGTRTSPTARCRASRSTSSAPSTKRRSAARRHRHSAPGHRPHRTHRLQRTGFAGDSRGPG